MPMGRPLLLALALIASHTAAMTPGADPGVNAPFDRPDPQRWSHILEQPGRELYDRRHAIIAALALKPGMDVADVGAGTGLFTLPIAQAVGPRAGSSPSTSRRSSFAASSFGRRHKAC